eukprot:746700-Hanusia_phi.AAC.5
MSCTSSECAGGGTFRAATIRGIPYRIATHQAQPPRGSRFDPAPAAGRPGPEPSIVTEPSIITVVRSFRGRRCGRTGCTGPEDFNRKEGGKLGVEGGIGLKAGNPSRSFPPLALKPWRGSARKGGGRKGDRRRGEEQRKEKIDKVQPLDKKTVAKIGKETKVRCESARKKRVQEFMIKRSLKKAPQRRMDAGIEPNAFKKNSTIHLAMSTTDSSPTLDKEGTESLNDVDDCIIVDGANDNGKECTKPEKKKRERAAEKLASKQLQNRSISAFLIKSKKQKTDEGDATKAESAITENMEVDHSAVKEPKTHEPNEEQENADKEVAAVVVVTDEDEAKSTADAEKPTRAEDEKDRMNDAPIERGGSVDSELKGDATQSDGQEKKAEAVKKASKPSKPVQKMSDAEKAKRILQLHEELASLKSDKVFADSSLNFRPSDVELQGILEDLQTLMDDENKSLPMKTRQILARFMEGSTKTCDNLAQNLLERVTAQSGDDNVTFLRPKLESWMQNVAEMHCNDNLKTLYDPSQTGNVKGNLHILWKVKDLADIPEKYRPIVDQHRKMELAVIYVMLRLRVAHFLI